MFLVLLQHDMDDLPVAIFEFRDHAEAFAASLSWDDQSVQDVFGIDATTPNVISIVEYEQAPIGWRPVKKTLVRDYYKEMDELGAASV